MSECYACKKCNTIDRRENFVQVTIIDWNEESGRYCQNCYSAGEEPIKHLIPIGPFHVALENHPNSFYLAMLPEFIKQNRIPENADGGSSFSIVINWIDLKETIRISSQIEFFEKLKNMAIRQKCNLWTITESFIKYQMAKESDKIMEATYKKKKLYELRAIFAKRK